MRKPRMDMGLLLAKQKEQLVELFELEENKTQALLDRDPDLLMEICKNQEELSQTLEASALLDELDEEERQAYPLFGEIQEIVLSIKDVVDRNEALIHQNSAMIDAVLGQLSGRESVEVYTDNARPVRSSGESILVNVTS